MVENGAFFCPVSEEILGICSKDDVHKNHYALPAPYPSEYYKDRFWPNNRGDALLIDQIRIVLRIAKLTKQQVFCPQHIHFCNRVSLPFRDY
jgi:hypothetical protein